ncbi:MAG: hypothetical protein AMXMBFR33_53470 [Candidatus Xenobia bacterium]
MGSKKGASRRGITYPDARDEALCWGWIDGKVKSLDEERTVQRFTPARKARPKGEQAEPPVQKSKQARPQRSQIKAMHRTRAPWLSRPPVVEAPFEGLPE